MVLQVYLTVMHRPSLMIPTLKILSETGSQAGTTAPRGLLLIRSTYPMTPSNFPGFPLLQTTWI